MKALILAAGYGTRLLPYTEKIPKPLFTLMSIPVLEHTIEKLVDHGCEQILINTHHLYDQIDAFLQQRKYSVDIQTIYEPEILDTGGAIANARPFLKDSLFFVMNSDIISSVDLQKLAAFHNKSTHLATLVLHDHERFNKVGIDDQGYIRNFDSKTNGLAFTGIQVLSPQIYDYFPDKRVFSSIEVYQDLCRRNQVKAMVETNIFWSDIGTKKDYSRTSLQFLAAHQFGIEPDRIGQLQIENLAGDGSDRIWYRITHENQSTIISDHGICLPKSDALLQLNAFLRIGGHLFTKGIPVPSIFNHDTLSGMVILEDLGDVHLETLIKQENNSAFTLKMYKLVIDRVIDFSITGSDGFKTEWTCQTETYSKEVILEKECQYFIEAFIQGYLKLDVTFHDFLDEFEYIADQAQESAFMGLMHRDMQSRNIMIHNNQIYFIDFQSARLGPLQYDLASLLIDPYVTLNDEMRNDLLEYAMETLGLNPVQCQNFTDNYRYCCLTRNLQFLGAFSFLSQIKMKKNFERYIPDAVTSLKTTIRNLNTDKLPKLTALVQSL